VIHSERLNLQLFPMMTYCDENLVAHYYTSVYTQTASWTLGSRLGPMPSDAQHLINIGRMQAIDPENFIQICRTLRNFVSYPLKDTDRQT